MIFWPWMSDILEYPVPVDQQLLMFFGSLYFNIVSFSKNSWKFATSLSQALGCYWLYKKVIACLNWRDL